jgi:PII-like signaling protein
MAAASQPRRLLAFLTGDGRSHRRAVAERVVERALALGSPDASWVTDQEGLGVRRHLRSERLPDLGRGLPIVVHVTGRRRRSSPCGRSFVSSRPVASSSWGPFPREERRVPLLRPIPPEPGVILWSAALGYA